MEAGDTKLQVSWQPPADENKAPAEQYRIQYREEGGSNQELHTTRLSQQITDLTNGVTYEVQVTAKNAAGYGTPSDEMSDTPQAGTAAKPDTPQQFTGEAVYHRRVALDWDVVADADSYEVQFYDWDSGELVVLPFNGVPVVFSGSSAVVDNLPEGRLWWLQVRAVNTAGASEWTQMVQILPTKASDWKNKDANSPATGAPTISGTAQVGETLTADTSGISDADGLTSVSYSYQWVANDGNADADIQDATDLTYKVSDDDVGKTIKVRVSFKDNANNEESLTSEATAVVTRPPPRAPRFDAISIHDGMLRVSYANLDLIDINVPAADLGSYITSFKVQWKSGSQEYDATRQAVLAPEPVTSDKVNFAHMPSYDITGLTNGVEYTVRVIATNAGGDGPPSQERTVAPNPKPEQLRQYIEEVVEEYEDSHPWLRTTWDYLQNNNIPLYVWDDVYDAPRSYYFGDSPGLSVLAMFVRSTHFDESTADAAEPDKKNAVLGKLALTYTLMNGVSSNPGPLGIAYMYFELFFQQPIVPYAGCNPRGLYLDVVMALLHDSFSGADHWNWCMERSEDATALEVVRSALNGQTPAWFAETYHDPEGSPDLERFWEDVQRANNDIIAYQLRDSFGGYCDTDPAWWIRIYRSVSMFYEPLGMDILVNPWRDGGCVPSAPVSLTANLEGDGTASVSWEAPESNGGALLSGYRIEWWSTDAGDGATTSQKHVRYDDWSDEPRPSEVSETVDGLTDGIEYTVRVVAYNPNGDGAAAEVTVGEVETNSPATGGPAIGGTAQVGQTLTADTTGIADADGLTNVTYDYQWLADDVNVEGAANPTYTLADSDQGKAIKVKVSFTDDANNQEMLTSPATAAVAARPNNQATGSPTISGTAQEESTGICDRTPQIRDAIMRELDDVDRCEDVTGEDLAGINGFSNTNLTNSGIESIQAGDFEGLVNLGLLNLSGNRISELPPGVFDEFTGKLLYLALTGNEIQSLPEGIFDGLPNLNGLWLDDNNLKSLPAGVFDEQSDLFGVWLDGNELTSLPAGVFDHNPALSKVYLDNNAIAELPDGVFDRTPNLSVLSLSGNSIVTLPEDVFVGLEDLEKLYLYDNAITALPEDVFDGLAGLEALSLSGNSIAALPQDVFDGLTGFLWWLSLAGNDLTSLPEGVFDDLDKLRILHLDDNSLVALPEGVFDNNHRLWYLTLNDNELTSLPANFLPDRDSPILGSCLALSGNRLEELPDDFLHVESSLPIVVQLGDNPGAPFAFTMEAVLVNALADQDGFGAAQVRYRVLRGAPVRMEAELSVTGGAASASTVVVRPREVYSDVITVTQSVKGEPATLILGDDLGIVMEECHYWDSDGGRHAFEFSGISFEAGSPLTLFETTSNQADAVDPEPNSPATGVPAISGTAQVGQTLTADTSGIADQDGLTNVSYDYLWIRSDGGTDTDIEGETGSTYTLVSADQGKTIKVKVSFTDDANNQETLTSAATAVVAAPPAPLTASFLAAPSFHDGDNSFTFELRFSEEVEVSYLTLRDHVFTETGGQVTGASRLDQPGNLRWQIVVEPDSEAGVTIVLPPTTDCGAQGAICTGDGRKLSGRVELTVNGPEQQGQEPQNSPATGLPTISGTVQVGETLTVDTSGIADADGKANAAFAYQWTAGDSDIDGATGSSYTLVAADEGQAIKVKVSFTDDKGNPETLTSAATAAVAPRPPLTVSLESSPQGHNGTDEFTFEIRFSEEFKLSYQTLKSHAFNVTGGEVLKAQRMDKPSNIPWRITVRPGSNGDVTIVLPVTTDCNAQGAICTEDGRKLTNRLELTVSGPDS